MHKHPVLNKKSKCQHPKLKAVPGPSKQVTIAVTKECMLEVPIYPSLGIHLSKARAKAAPYIKSSISQLRPSSMGSSFSLPLTLGSKLAWWRLGNRTQETSSTGEFTAMPWLRPGNRTHETMTRDSSKQMAAWLKDLAPVPGASVAI